MVNVRPIHNDFLYFLNFKEKALIDLFTDLRLFILEIYPESNELLYHTHALTSIFSISDNFADAFCTLPIYTSHVNLAFNKGTLLNDPHQLLTGTGKLMRHIPVTTIKDYRNKNVKDLVKTSIEFAKRHMDKQTKTTGVTISKIKIN